MMEFDPLALSLCTGCRHVRTVRSGKGSQFLMCQLAKTDARFQKYAPQPVVSCAGFEPPADEGEGFGVSGPAPEAP